jgi:hypothetical protein
MKNKILLLVLAITLLGCSNDDSECSCEKETWHKETTTQFYPNGLPYLTVVDVLDYKEQVTCQIEVDFQQTIGNEYYVIKCLNF